VVESVGETRDVVVVTRLTPTERDALATPKTPPTKSASRGKVPTVHRSRRPTR
jgi:hypothetical protein